MTPTTGSTWTMPRDMSGYSDLEAGMLAAIHAAGLPEPVAEYRFDRGCCGCSMRYHPVLRPGRCNACVAEGREHPTFSREGRRWRFDFAWPDRRLAVECEGGTHSGGRHVRGEGFAADAEKYNAAALQGWTVLRFTGAQVESGYAVETIERALALRDGVST